MQYRIAGKHEIDERMGGDGYAQTMVELIAQDSSVVHIDCDLAGCSKASEIAKVYPAQVINAGIAGSECSRHRGGSVGGREDTVCAFFWTLYLTAGV